MVILVDGGIIRTTWRQADVINGTLMSSSQVVDDILEFHRVSGFAVWYRVSDALVDVDYQTTSSVVSCVCAISVPTHSVKARDL